MEKWNEIYINIDQEIDCLLQRLQQDDPEAYREVGRILKNYQERTCFDAEKAFHQLERHLFWRKVMKITALAGCIIGICILSIWLIPSSDNLPSGKIVQNQSNQINPATWQVQLTLSDGTNFYLNKQPWQKKEQGGIVIQVDSCGIYYTVNNSSVREARLRNILTTSKGEICNVVLQDGSRVWLSAATRFSYPLQFTGKERIVEVEGEAYFEVSTDSSHPFVVKTLHGDIKAHGTSFYVKQYPEENYLKTTLVKGKIDFEQYAKKAISLNPGEQLVYDAGTSEVKIKKLPYDISYNNNQFIFKEDSLEEIMNTLARWYNVNIIFQNQGIKKLRYSLSFVKRKDISEVIAFFKANSDIKLTLQGRTIIVSI